VIRKDQKDKVILVNRLRELQMINNELKSRILEMEASQAEDQEEMRS
jgi:hypothetical protein